jgi:hypothetical protein
MTLEEKLAKRRAYMREYMRRRYADRTPEQREADRQRYADRTPEQRDKAREHLRRRRANQTPEEKEARLAKQREYDRARRRAVALLAGARCRAAREGI